MTQSTKPYSGLSAWRLTELINAANPNQPTLVDGVDFLYGDPVASVAAGYNTRVRLKSLRPSRPKDRDIYYNRLPLDVLNELPPAFIQPVVTDKETFTIHGILEEINYALGLDLEPQEVLNTTHNLGEPSYPLIIKEGASLAWLGNTRYDFKVDPLVIDLSAVIRVTNLDGLYPPDPVV